MPTKYQRQCVWPVHNGQDLTSPFALSTLLHNPGQTAKEDVHLLTCMHTILMLFVHNQIVSTYRKAWILKITETYSLWGYWMVSYIRNVKSFWMISVRDRENRKRKIDEANRDFSCNQQNSNCRYVSD